MQELPAPPPPVKHIKLNGALEAMKFSCQLDELRKFAGFALANL